MLKYKDTFNNQFSLQYYLHKKKISTDIINFAKQENLDINYVCFISKDNNIITTNITKRKQNGYRLITILNKDVENNIIDNRRHNISSFIELCISYNCIVINISKRFETLNIILSYATIFKNKRIKEVKIRSIQETLRLYKHVFDKNIDTTQVNKIFVTNNKTLSILENQKIPYITICKEVKNARIANIYADTLEIKSSGESFVNCNVKNLIFRSCCDLFLPNMLEHLILSNTYNKKLGIILCPNLKSIEFGHSFNQIIDYPIFHACTSLLSIKFGNSFGQYAPNRGTGYIEPNALPQSVKFLYFGQKYKVPIKENVLPPYLEELHFGEYFGHCVGMQFIRDAYYKLQIRGIVLPKTLIRIIVPHLCFNWVKDEYWIMNDVVKA